MDPEGNQLLAPYPVTLDNFEGPLDLLMRLIEERELEITEIALATVTDQYLGHLQQMTELDLAVASEFIVIAARLLDIKTRTLLPPQQPTDAEEAPADPAAELVERLLAFRQYKEVAAFLEAREAEEAPRFPRSPAEMKAMAAEIELAGVTLVDLAALFNEVLSQAARRGTDADIHEIAGDTVTVAQRQREVLWQIGKNKGRVVFLDLFAGQPTRLEVVVTLLAVLELLRGRRIRVVQHEPLGPIFIEQLTPTEKEPHPAGAPGAGESGP